MKTCICGKSFKTGISLQRHEQRCKKYQSYKLVLEQFKKEQRELKRLPNGMFICENPKCKKEHDGSYGSGRFCSLHCRKVFIGTHVNNPKGRQSPFKGKHHSNEAKQKLRIKTCERLMQCKPNHCNYNKSSIPILEQIAKEHGWNIQHAENGGEFYTGIGYWLDAYDKQKNIALEYDEPVHYDDAENNILREKDLKRQQEIIEHLHCEYWRYNEKTKCLWKVK